ELRRWKDAASLKLHPADYPWQRHRWAESNLWFARALGAARSGQAAQAKQDVAKLEEIRAVLEAAKEPYWTGQVENQARMGRAWIALAEGDKKTAETLMKQAAEVEDATEKHPVTPGPIVPARELYGDLLLELRQSEAALAAYKQSLVRSPGRFAAFAGAAKAAQRAGRTEEAREYYGKLCALAEHGDDTRPEMAEARAFLGKK